MYKEHLKNYSKILVSSIVHLEGNQIAFIYIFTFVLFLGIFVNYSAFPVYQRINDDIGTIEKLSDSIVAAKNRFQKIKKFTALLTDSRNKLLGRRDVFVDKSEVQNLISEIAFLGDKTGVDFIEFTPLPKKKNKYFMEIPVSISIKGGFIEVYSFIRNLTIAGSLITFDNLSIKSSDSSGSLSVQCVVKGYGSNDI